MKQSIECFAPDRLIEVLSVDHCSNIKDPRLSLKYHGPALNYSNDITTDTNLSVNTLFIVDVLVRI